MDIQTRMNAPRDDDKISWGIMDFITEGWRWLISGLVLGLVSAFIYLMVAPKQYEATAIFQVGKVFGSELESAGQLIERLKFPTFYEEEQLKACNVISDEPSVALSKQISPILLKGSNILQVSYRARDSALAVQCLEAVMDRAIKWQNKQSMSLIESAREQLELTKFQLEEAERVQMVLGKRSMRALDTADAKIQGVVVISAAQLTTDRVNSLRKSILEQMVNLEPPATRPAELIERVYASENAVLPKRLQVLMGGLFGGLALGGLVFFVRQAWLIRRS